MSNKSKYMIIAIWVIISLFLLSGAVYLLIKNIPKEKESDNEESKITITGSELNNYLKYIPKISTDYEGNLFYSHNKRTINDIAEEDLVGTALRTKVNGTMELNTEVATKEEIDELIKKMYNKNIESNNLEFITDGINIYDLKNNKYITINYTNYPQYYEVITKHEINKEELIIYTHVAMKYPNDNSLYAPAGNIIKEFTNANKEELVKYIKEHKEEFTLYKHTYQKNDTGYSWYSTENITNNN